MSPNYVGTDGREGLGCGGVQNISNQLQPTSVNLWFATWYVETRWPAGLCGGGWDDGAVVIFCLGMAEVGVGP